MSRAEATNESRLGASGLTAALSTAVRDAKPALLGTLGALGEGTALATAVRDAVAAGFRALGAALGPAKAALLVILAERAGGATHRAVAVWLGADRVEQRRDVQGVPARALDDSSSSAAGAFSRHHGSGSALAAARAAVVVIKVSALVTVVLGSHGRGLHVFVRELVEGRRVVKTVHSVDDEAEAHGAGKVVADVVVLVAVSCEPHVDSRRRRHRHGGRDLLLLPLLMLLRLEAAVVVSVVVVVVVVEGKAVAARVEVPAVEGRGEESGGRVDSDRNE